MSEALKEDKAYELGKAVGLSESEWKHFLSVLGRTPTVSEIQMIGVQWSEHCSYKSSKKYLKKLITRGPQVLQGPGENAGLVKLDEKRAIAFKVESHNHPSFVEPFQGAATGVGGILRDIFTMGARPIATGNYLRFGDLKTKKHRFLMEGVVSGIAHYGNCMGIPTVAGHISSDQSYNGNILVNVFALGIADIEGIHKSSTAEAGASIMIWGAKTGRDGIHGASLLASADFEDNEESVEQKIRVQVGDPFKEKCLMEATLEAMASLNDDLLAIQDMGAAGLTCSTLEISDKSGIGMKIDLGKVPVRESGMEAFELLLSESQERMLAIVKKGSERKFKKLLEKWECEAEVIGETTKDGRLNMEYKGERVVDLPVKELMDPPEASLPEPEWTLPVVSESHSIEEVTDEWSVLKNLLSEPVICSKREIFRQYDSTVGTKTVLGPGHEAAVLWVGNEDRPNLGVAFKGVACEDFAVTDPKFAAEAAMARAVRGLACVGAKALAYTDGVNIGNPNEPKVLGALSRTVDGLNNAADIFKTPCVGGNVSMYNQTVMDEKKTNIHPTIFSVVVGKMRDVRKATPSVFQKAGSEVWLLEVPGNIHELPFGSLYARLNWKGNSEMSRVLPFLDLKAEKNLQGALLQANDLGLFLSCRDVSQGGLAVSLAKACFGEALTGFEGDWSKTQNRRDFILFNEAQGRVVVEIDSARRAELMKLSLEWKLHAKRLGTVLEKPLFRIQPLMNGEVSELHKAWTDFIA